MSALPEAPALAAGARWRGSGAALVLVACCGARWYFGGVIVDLRRSAPSSGSALAQATTPTERVAASLLGGFRAILLTTLWIRAIELKQENRLLELPLCYRAIQELQSRSPAIYWIQAEHMALDLPRVLVGEEEERWRWIRRGLEVLAAGRRRFPADATLLVHGGFIYFSCFDPGSRAADRERFLGDPEINPDGRDPLSFAVEWLEAALEIARHEALADLMLAQVLLQEGALLDSGASGLPHDRPALERAKRRLFDHAARVHGFDPAAAARGAAPPTAEEERKGTEKPAPGR